MARYGMLINTKKCIGCYACRVACQMVNGLESDEAFIKFDEMEQGVYPNVYAEVVPVQCMHCEDAPCEAVCPTHATYTTDSGVVLVDEEKCIGCGTCQKSCPYDAPRIDAELSVSRKCDGCLARVRNDEQPMCVGSCPLRALEFGPIDELREKHGDLCQVPPLPEPTTGPNLVIGSCQAIDSDTYNLDEGYLANPLEVE